MKPTVNASWTTDRRHFMAVLSGLGIGGLFPGALWAQSRPAEVITKEMIIAAEAIAGVSFEDVERAALVKELNDQRGVFDRLRKLPLDHETPPATVFDPERFLRAAAPASPAPPAARPSAARPTDDVDLAYMDIRDLGDLLRQKRVTSVELTELSLSRLERLDPRLLCVVTLLRAGALERAAAMDRELAGGKDRGPLHGIPWGAKDIIATRGSKTTWGAKPLRDQVVDHDAAVVERLDGAGAVLVAKLTTGALAMGDVWFGGTTKNPWNLAQGSSGSSAGPASAVAAGCVPFAIGSETLGSIVSPSVRCSVTGFRPSFGRVSRWGVMALSWTMDKMGPLTRSAADAALVFAAIHGADRRDPSSVSRPFVAGAAIDLAKTRFGHLAGGDARPETAAAIAALEDLGAEFRPVSLPEFPAGDLMPILSAEAACAFDDFLRDGKARELDAQGPRDWPQTFRAARFISAVDYLRAQRLRTDMVKRLDAALAEIDILVCGPYAQSILMFTNMSGHPAVCLPSTLDAKGKPGAVTFIGTLHGDDHLLAVAAAFQNVTEFHRARPNLD